ncbi:hypothetical protein K431DRAFT_227860 [Polychaeton citri CBS 116435]|uniref:Uncharacterized protein n=1 Tax=Polychaeton citri CBS 116435 TaxID=1314669 RepID=A0A9P4Q541_9PEZI|nr:hypothetical protein K431DRAFT_227860 [Polychaeton citri CBS 116435]
MSINSTTAERTNLSDLNNIGFIAGPTDSDSVCGHDRHEALAAGCHYDLMASRWYTQECYNGEVLNEFLGEVDLDWYQGEDHTQPATMDLVRSWEFDKLYPLHDYHILHCLYQWRRLHLAFIEHRHIDEDVFS